jgi:EmrB/QacA subfamily drug resistance transporter
MFMSVLDVSIVNVAIPAMQKTYGASTSDIEWVATAYNLCLGVVVPASAWLGEKFGLRRLYIVSILGFAVFSGLCGTADSLGFMIFYRILQAVPGGLLPVTCLAVLTRIVPPKQLGAAMGLYGLGMVVAPGIGPALGGYLVQHLDWRLIFFINVPVGLLGAVAAKMVLPQLPGRRSITFDLPGFACAAAGLFAILLAVSEGHEWGWTSYPVLILVAVAVNLIVLFVVIERHVPEPLLDVRVFLRWSFTNSILLVSLLSTGFFATVYYVPLFLQNGQNVTPMNTGLTVLPQAVAMMLIMPIAGRIYDRFGARWPAVAGVLLAGIGLGMMSGFNPDMARGQIVLWTVVQASGLAIAFMPIMTAGLAGLPPHLVDSGNAYINLAQRFAGALGIALFTALTTAWQAQDMADRSGLLGQEAPTNTTIQSLQQQGQGGLLPLWEQTYVAAQAQSYSNAFLCLSALTIGGAFLALLFRHGRPEPGTHVHVEIG